MVAKEEGYNLVDCVLLQPFNLQKNHVALITTSSDLPTLEHDNRYIQVVETELV